MKKTVTRWVNEATGRKDGTPILDKQDRAMLKVIFLVMSIAFVCLVGLALLLTALISLMGCC